MVGDLPFYEMPFVDGESLRQRLDREKQLQVSDAALTGGAATARRGSRTGADRRRPSVRLALPLALAGLAAWGWLRTPEVRTGAPRTVRATLVLPPDRILALDLRPFDLRRDGSELAYAGGGEGTTRSRRSGRAVDARAEHGAG